MGAVPASAFTQPCASQGLTAAGWHSGCACTGTPQRLTAAGWHSGCAALHHVHASTRPCHGARGGCAVQVGQSPSRRLSIDSSSTSCRPATASCSPAAAASSGGSRQRPRPSPECAADSGSPAGTAGVAASRRQLPATSHRRQADGSSGGQGPSKQRGSALLALLEEEGDDAPSPAGGPEGRCRAAAAAASGVCEPSEGACELASPVLGAGESPDGRDEATSAAPAGPASLPTAPAAALAQAGPGAAPARRGSGSAAAGAPPAEEQVAGGSGPGGSCSGSALPAAPSLRAAGPLLPSPGEDTPGPPNPSDDMGATMPALPWAEGSLPPSAGSDMPRPTPSDQAAVTIKRNLWQQHFRHPNVSGVGHAGQRSARARTCTCSQPPLLTPAPGHSTALTLLLPGAPPEPDEGAVDVATHPTQHLPAAACDGPWRAAPRRPPAEPVCHVRVPPGLGLALLGWGYACREVESGRGSWSQTWAGLMESDMHSCV
jgi:hypothetical protein